MPIPNELVELSGPYAGDQLADAYRHNELDGFCDEGPGVYLWLRRISPTSEQIATQEAFLNWIRGELARSQGVVTDTLRHMGKMSLSVGGAHLDERKLKALGEVAGTRRERQHVQALLRQFDYTVSLYVGETQNVADRIRQHLAGQTDFSARLNEYGYAWGSVGLKYAVLDNWTASQRRALERSLAIFTLAPNTSRAG